MVRFYQKISQESVSSVVGSKESSMCSFAIEREMKQMTGKND